MPAQKVTSLGQSHRSSKCQSKRLPPLGKATARANVRAKGYLPWAKPPLEQMSEQKVTSLGQSHPSSKCQSKKLPPLALASPRANVRAKGYLPWAKPPLEQMSEQKVTSLDLLFANRISLIHNGQAGQGAGRGPGVRPTRKNKWR